MSEKDDTSSDANPELETWLAEPYTVVSLERIKRVMEPNVLAGLLHACKSSTDPKVASWYVHYVWVQDMKEFLTKGEFPK